MKRQMKTTDKQINKNEKVRNKKRKNMTNKMKRK